MKKIFTDEQEKFMIENYLTMSYKEIGEKLGLPEAQIKTLRIGIFIRFYICGWVDMS